MKRKTRIAMAVVSLLSLFIITTRAQPAPTRVESRFDADRPDARLGLLWGAPPGVQEYTREISGYISRGEMDKAEARIRDALIATKNNPDVLILAGHVFTVKRQFYLAEDAWAQVAAQYPSNAWAQACWGGMLLRVERWEKADDVLSAARRMDPKELVARYNLACSRLHAGTQLPLWMLDDLTAEEIGRIATWIAGEPDILGLMMSEDGYRKLCHAVLTGQIHGRQDDRKPDLAALNRQMKDVAAAIWEAYEANQKKDWNASIRALNKAVSLGATAPAIQAELASCRARLTQSNGPSRLQIKAASPK